MQKILHIMLLFFAIFLSQFSYSFWSEIKVEDVFSDISQDYKYYNELQTLYDRGMIFPDSDWKFSARKLLNRDEFVWISMEVTCKKCISPNTEYSFIEKYTNTKPFFDVWETNKYFYCIAESDAKWYVKWYNKNFTCEDWAQLDEQRPFCVNNKITLEEAIAVILRNSGIFSIEDNKKVLQKIYSGEIDENLSDDVKARNSDGTAYTFYWYFQKALEFELLEYDSKWNEKIYKLLEVKNNKIRPGQSISKEDFLRIAYIALKSNSCRKIEKKDLAINMNILNKSCQAWDQNCSNTRFDQNESTFDFRAKEYWVCEKWVRTPDWYIWRFYNQNTGQEIKKYWKYIDNYTFLSDGSWKVYLRVIDNCWNTAEVYSSLQIWKSTNIQDSNDPGSDSSNPNDPSIDDSTTNQDPTDSETNNIWWLGVQILADPILWSSPLKVNFQWVVQSSLSNLSYSWNFWDWDTSYGKEVDHVYKNVGSYTVTLTVTDGNWNRWEAITIVRVVKWDGDNSNVDTDNDNVPDTEDSCPLIPWSQNNNWCPILEQSCDVNCECSNWYTCSTSDPNICSTQWVCRPKIELLNSCLQKNNNNFIYWNAICNSCPCANFVDFTSQIRWCDILFPAITSPDSSQIYSRWSTYTIKK